MKKSKLLAIILILVIITGCNKSSASDNEFQNLFDVDTDIVKSMTYAELLELTESKTGVVFIGESNNNTKELAQIFCNKLCECDVNKAHFVHSDDINDNQLLSKFNVEKLNYPIVVAYYKGELVGFYDNATETSNLNTYIDELIHSAYPAVCTEAC